MGLLLNKSLTEQWFINLFQLNFKQNIDSYKMSTLMQDETPPLDVY